MKRGVRIALAALLSVASLVLVFGVLSQRSTPDLAPWHTVKLRGEFRAQDARDGFGWPDYLRLEEELFRELEEEIVSPSGTLANPHWNRFAAEGINNPANFPVNWNRSFEFAADAPVGGVLLIHGLTDSPYSLRRTAEILHDRGFHVVGLRLPGHGTAPSGLLDASVADWQAAVHLAALHLQSTVGDSGELVFVGYSNGGALALDLALDSLEDESLRVPDHVVLFSPAIGITRVAVLARAHRILSFLPFFRKLEWSSVNPEYDPFKYNSFPKDAGYATHVLTRSIRARLAKLQERGATADFPRVLTFMSLADATVRVEAVVSGLYDRLSLPDNELVIFDINRDSAIRGFFRGDPAGRLKTLVERPTTPYRLTVLSNRDDDSSSVVVRSRPAGEAGFAVSDPGLEWPRGVYSLSHVALPFAPDDPINGLWPAAEEGPGLRLGALEPRGERDLLAVSAAQLTRLRSNPFFPYIERRLLELAPDRTAWELRRVLEVEGRQGIATDGERYYVSGSTSLFVYDKTGIRRASNEKPFAELNKRANHIGDISVHDGELYAGIEWFDDGQGSNIQVAIYDANTLTYKRSVDWEPDSGQVEVSAVVVDPERGAIWMTDWVDGRYVYRYDLATGEYRGKLRLLSAPRWPQGIAVRGGALFITADDGDAELDEVDNLWRVDVRPGATEAHARHARAFTEFRRTGEIEGIAFDRAAGEMLVLHNRGKRIVRGMPTGLYPGYDREIHELYVYADRKD